MEIPAAAAMSSVVTALEAAFGEKLVRGLLDLGEQLGAAPVPQRAGVC